MAIAYQHYVLGVCLLAYIHSLLSRTLPSFLASVPTPGCQESCRGSVTVPLCNGELSLLPEGAAHESYRSCLRCRARAPPFEDWIHDSNFYNLQDGACIAHWQYGILMGYGFAVPFVIGSVLAAKWVDRMTSHKVLAFSIIAWSVATAIQALATSIVLVAVCRAIVGMVQAFTVPTAFKITTDNFDPASHGFVTSLLSAGVCLGAAAGSFAVPTSMHYGWRLTSLAVGCSGMVLGTVVLFTIRGRGPIQSAELEESSGIGPRSNSSFRNTPVVWVLTTGTSCRLIVGYVLSVFLPVYYMRADLPGYSVNHYAAANSVIVACTGLGSAVWAGLAADALSTRFPAAPMFIVSMAQVAAAGFAVGIFCAETFATSLAFYAATLLVGECWLGLTLLQAKGAVSKTVQGQTVAVLLSLATVACEAGPALVGLLDRGTASIGMIMLAVVSFGYLSAAALFMLTTVWAGPSSKHAPSIEPMLSQSDIDHFDGRNAAMTAALSLQGLTRAGTLVMTPKTSTRKPQRLATVA